MKMEGFVEANVKNNVGWLTFGHPAQNSMPLSLLDAVRFKIRELDHNEDVKVIVMQSEGDKAFCAGANINELASLKNSLDATRFFMGFADLMTTIKRCPKPVIAKVHGRVVGGGIGLISACDYVLASQKATIRLSELSIAIGPFVIGPFVERRLGISGFTSLALNPFEWKTAEWAKQNGLFYEVFGFQSQLDDYTEYYAEKLANLDGDALHEVKRMLWSSHPHIESGLEERAALSGRLVLEESAQKAIAQFINK